MLHVVSAWRESGFALLGEFAARIGADVAGAFPVSVDLLGSSRQDGTGRPYCRKPFTETEEVR